MTVTSPKPSAEYLARVIRSLETNRGFVAPGEQHNGTIHNAYRGFSGKAGAPYSGWGLQFEYDTRAAIGKRVMNPRIVAMAEAVAAS